MHHGKKASKFKLHVRVAGELGRVESNLDRNGSQKLST